MKQRPAKNDVVWRWIDGHLSQSIGDEDAAKLDERLLSDPDARQLYVDYCKLHAGILFEVHNAEAMQRAADCFPIDNAACQPTVDREQSAPRLQRGWAYRAGLAVAAVACFVMLGSWVSNQSQSPDDAIARPVADASQDESSPGLIEPIREARDESVSVAIVSGMVDCRTASGVEPLQLGQPLLSGTRVGITSGLLQLTFENGTEVTLRAPTAISLMADDSCDLLSGNLSVRGASAQSSGFKLQTAGVELVNLGGDFGADVRTDGAIQLHVFAGEVVLTAGTDDEPGVHVLAGEAMSISPKTEKIDYFAADRSAFPSNLAPRFSDEELPPLPVTDDLALWLAADGLVTTDVNGRVVAWRDILVGENQSNEDAWQQSPESRPALAPSAIGGKPALRFDGSSDYLETTPLKSTADQTILMIFSRASDIDPSLFEKGPSFRQLLNYNGPVHDLYEPRDEPHERHALQICDRLKNGHYWGRVSAYFGPKPVTVKLGSVIANRHIEVNQPALLTYTYLPSVNRALLFIDGELQGANSAPVGQKFTSRKVIGRSPAMKGFFHGDLAELLIFNGRLAETDLLKVHRYLGTKYSIDVESRNLALVNQQLDQLKPTLKKPTRFARGKEPGNPGEREDAEVEKN